MRTSCIYKVDSCWKEW